VGARRLGQDEKYLTVREILSEASTLADGALSRERSDFYRFGYATLGFAIHLLMMYDCTFFCMTKGATAVGTLPFLKFFSIEKP
jgi:hypothetical protein